jgi:hypothetical protein
MRRCFYLAACLLRAPQAGAASVDCAKASRPAERLICGDPALSTAVEVLADADAVATALGPQIIRAGQRAWMAQRDKLANAVDLVAAYSDRTAGNRRRRGRECLSARPRGGNGPRLRGARIDKVVIFWAVGADDFTAYFSDKKAPAGTRMTRTGAPSLEDVRTRGLCAFKPKQKICRNRGP